MKASEYMGGSETRMCNVIMFNLFMDGVVREVKARVGNAGVELGYLIQFCDRIYFSLSF